MGAAPYYDYKMIDSDYLMLPTLANYLLNLPQGANRSEEFLSQQATLVSAKIRFEDNTSDALRVTVPEMLRGPSATQSPLSLACCSASVPVTSL